MKRQLKSLFALCTVIALMLTCVSGVYATSKGKGHEQVKYKFQQKQKFNFKGFKDVGNGHWAYNAISNLCKKGIVVGYDDNSFRPNELVTRSQFAAMLANTLELNTKSKTQTFKDVPVYSWDYKVVEAAKAYLTGYKASDGDLYFYGSKSAVREDMAVALIKALELKLVSDDDELEEIFDDYDSISKNLRDFVYTAYTEKIMIGSDDKFNPQGSLTRAEAAALLDNAIKKLEKVVVDETIDDEETVDEDASSDATLKDLEYDGKNVEDFDEENTYYVVKLEDDEDIPSVTAKANNPEATVTISQVDDVPGYAKIIVLAEDGTKKIYYIKFVLEENSEATLRSLEYDGKTVEDFDEDTTSYTVELEDDEDIPTVSAVASNSKAKVTVTQATDIPGVAKVLVKAEDGTTKTYKVRFVVED